MIDAGQTESGEQGQSPAVNSASAEPRSAEPAGLAISAHGDFERYGLLAALTLVVLALLLADRLRPSQELATVPPADRLLRVRIGGNIPRAPRTPPLKSPGAIVPPPRRTHVTPDPTPHVILDPPPRHVPAPAPPVPSAASVVVKSGETLGEIALRELGTSKRATEIAALNGITDLAKVREGRKLLLPPR